MCIQSILTWMRMEISMNTPRFPCCYLWSLAKLCMWSNYNIMMHFSRSEPFKKYLEQFSKLENRLEE